MADTGPGLSAEQLTSLFEPFNGLGAERTGTVGSGLGLVIAKGLIEAMVGAISVGSEAGMGTTVHLTLPAAARLLEPDAAAPAMAEHIDELPPACLRTVLYVEDDPVNTVLVQHLFAEEPHWLLLTAETGCEGLELARDKQPDLVLSDMNLPDMNGFQLLDRLVDYWTKPVDVQIVHCRLRRMLAERAGAAWERPRSERGSN